MLLRSDPAKDALLSVAPKQVHLWFSEHLNAALSTAEVFNGAHERVDNGDAHRSPNDPTEMDVTLKPDLPPAVYVVLYRSTSSDDGHILSGSLLFTVVRPDGTVPTLSPGTPPPTLGESSSSPGQLDAPTSLNLFLLFFIELGTIFWVGAAFWRCCILFPAREEHYELQIIAQQTERRFDLIFSLPTVLLLLLAHLGLLFGQAFTLAGNGGQAFSLSLLAQLVTSGQYGFFWLLRVSLLLLAGGCAWYQFHREQQTQSSRPPFRWIQLILGLLLLITLALSSHAAAVDRSIVAAALVVDWLHLLAATLWVGGMLCIALLFLPTLRHLTLPERAQALVTVLPYYSPYAGGAVLILSLTGPFSAAVHLTSWSQLITTAYGRVLVIKVLLVGLLILTSAFHVLFLRPRMKRTYQKYREWLQPVLHSSVLSLVPALSPLESTSDPISSPLLEQVNQYEKPLSQQIRSLTHILRWEPLLGVAVLICVALMNVFGGTLVPAQPSPTSQPAFQTSVKTKDQQFFVTLEVSPNQAGSNQFTVEVREAATNHPASNIGVSLYVSHLDMDMGTETINLQPDQQGKFRANGDLVMGGRWQVRTQVRTIENTLHEAVVIVPVPL